MMTILNRWSNICYDTVGKGQGYVHGHCQGVGHSKHDFNKFRDDELIYLCVSNYTSL